VLKNIQFLEDFVLQIPYQYWGFAPGPYWRTSGPRPPTFNP